MVSDRIDLETLKPLDNKTIKVQLGRFDTNKYCGVNTQTSIFSRRHMYSLPSLEDRTQLIVLGTKLQPFAH